MKSYELTLTVSDKGTGESKTVSLTILPGMDKAVISQSIGDAVAKILTEVNFSEIRQNN